MVGVQSDEKCPECGYLHGFYELQTRTSEEYFLCNRCGYHHSTHVVIDKAKSKRIKEQVHKFVKQGKIDEAFDLARLKLKGYKDGKECTEKDLSRKEKLEHLKLCTFQYIKIKNGKRVYATEESGGHGAYSYMGVKGFGTTGTLKNDGRKGFEKWVKEHIKDLKEVYYTKKVNGRWVRVDLKNDKEEEFKDNTHRHMKAK